MATSTIPRTAIKGGSFLIESCRPEEIFSPADLSDDQKLIGQTAEEFVTKEVLPLANELEQIHACLFAPSGAQVDVMMDIVNANCKRAERKLRRVGLQVDAGEVARECRLRRPLERHMS